MTTPEVVDGRKTPASLQIGQDEGKLMNGNGLAWKRKKKFKFFYNININNLVSKNNQWLDFKNITLRIYICVQCKLENNTKPTIVITWFSIHACILSKASTSIPRI